MSKIPPRKRKLRKLTQAEKSLVLKPLFIPLMTRYFEQFQSGVKKHEYRLYGPRWNEDVCVIGRHVILSKGYGKQNRLRGRIISFERITQDQMNTYTAALASLIYRGKEGVIARIGIELIGMEPR